MKKEPTEDKKEIDWKLATVRQNCLNEAVKARPGDPLPLANEMFKFVIGETVENEPKTKGWK